jgi:hypothetical protein
MRLGQEPEQALEPGQEPELAQEPERGPQEAMQPERAMGQQPGGHLLRQVVQMPERVVEITTTAMRMQSMRLLQHWERPGQPPVGRRVGRQATAQALQASPTSITSSTCGADTPLNEHTQLDVGASSWDCL